MEVLLEKYPYRYVECGTIELNGQPDYRIQKYNTYTDRYRDMYLCDNFMQLETAMEDFQYTKWLDPSHPKLLHTQKMREQLIKALLAHAQGDIQKHVANVEVYLTNPAGIGEHSNIVEAIEQELDMIAKYQDQIDVIQKYFKK